MTTLLALAAVWVVVALVAALWFGRVMRHAEQADRRRTAVPPSAVTSTALPEPALLRRSA